MTPRLLTWGEKGIGKPSMMIGGTGVHCDLVRVDLEPMSRASVLLLLNFRKFLLIQLRMSSRQRMREVGGMAAVGLDENGESSRVSCTEEVVGDFDQGCFSAVF